MTAAPHPPGARGGRDALVTVLLVAAAVALHGLIGSTARLELHFEEAQYWVWSTRLDWSYATKGPLVAWLIAASTALAGDGETGVRLFAWVAHGLFLAAVYGFARDLWGRGDAAGWALALAAAMPAFLFLGGVMTTDVFLFLAWTLALWAAYRALVVHRRAAWYAMGGAVGVGALGKLSIGLLPAATAVAMLTRRAWRRQYLSAAPWVAAALVLLIMAPVIGWNAAHDWVMVRHEQGHVLGGGSSVKLAELVAGQLLVVSPALLLTLAVVLWRPPREAGPWLVWLTAVAVLAFFVAKAAGSKVQPNWPVAAYIGLLVLLGGEAIRRGRRFRIWLGACIALALAQAGALLYLPPAAFPGGVDPLHELRGWRAPITRLAPDAAAADFVLSRNYHLASRLAFYLPHHPPVYLAGDADRRLNQFDLWPGPAGHRGGDALWVGREAALPEPVAAAFTACRPRDPVGQGEQRLFPWRCRGFQGVTWGRPGSH